MHLPLLSRYSCDNVAHLDLIFPIFIAPIYSFPRLDLPMAIPIFRAIRIPSFVRRRRGKDVVKAMFSREDIPEKRSRCPVGIVVATRDLRQFFR